MVDVVLVTLAVLVPRSNINRVVTVKVMQVESEEWTVHGKILWVQCQCVTCQT